LEPSSKVTAAGEQVPAVGRPLIRDMVDVKGVPCHRAVDILHSAY